jgi:hypothetical protein
LTLFQPIFEPSKENSDKNSIRPQLEVCGLNLGRLATCFCSSWFPRRVVVSLVVSSLCCLGLVAALMVWPACSPAHLGPLALSVLALLAFSSGLHLSALIGVANRLPRQYRGAILLGMVSEKTGKITYLVSQLK